MFDLLGLPMCNTGLSLFRMACKTASGPRFGGGSGGRPSALAAACTEKWKLKRKTANNANNNNVTKKDGTATTIVMSTQLQSHVRQPSLQYGNKQRNDMTMFSAASANDICNSPVVSPVWGNGRDWRRPADSEGDWVRVFPFVPTVTAPQMAQPRVRPSQQFTRPVSSTAPTAAENDTARSMIKNVQEYLRCCKKVARLYEGLSGVSDDELNEKLKDLFPAATKTWLPPN